MGEPDKILSIGSLKIGYVSGKSKKILLPPLNATAHGGELIAVIGKNGIGKSTLLRTLTGLQPSLGGEISLYNKNLKDYQRNELAQKVGYISTEVIKVSNMRVYDLVALGRYPHTNWIGSIGEKDHQAIISSLEQISMASFSNKFVAELSDGERQKVMIARILAQDTGLMIMDEPTAFLDVGSKYEIFHILNMLTGCNNKTIIFSTHDLQMAISQSDKIWLILDDRLIEGAPEDLLISGAFEKLFVSSSIRFNSEDGTFSFPGAMRGEIFIEGEGLKRYWTGKAINRAGYRVTERNTFPYIKITEGRNDWELVFRNSAVVFNSVYDLVTALKKESISFS